mgnify:CR=1 FL=1
MDMAAPLNPGRQYSRAVVRNMRPRRAKTTAVKMTASVTNIHSA